MKSTRTRWNKGDMVMCIKSGRSLTRNESYEEGTLYTLSHTEFSDDTIGIIGIEHCCLSCNFKLFVETEIINSYEIY